MLADLMLAWKRLIKAPGFTVTAVMILTFAIGANAAVFSIADAALVVIAIAVLAAYVPARRVSRIDPLVVLRAE